MMVKINNAMPAKAYSTEQAAGCGMIASIYAALWAPGKKYEHQGRTPDSVCQRIIDLQNWSGLSNNWVHGSLTVHLKKDMGTDTAEGFVVDENNKLVKLVKEFKALEASIARSAVIGPKSSSDTSTHARHSRWGRSGAGGASLGASAGAAEEDAAHALDRLAASADFEIVESGGLYFCALCSSALEPPGDMAGVCSDPAGACAWAAAVREHRATASDPSAAAGAALRGSLMASTTSTADLMMSGLSPDDAAAALSALQIGAGSQAGAGAEGGGGRRGAQRGDGGRVARLGRPRTQSSRLQFYQSRPRSRHQLW